MVDPVNVESAWFPFRSIASSLYPPIRRHKPVSALGRKRPRAETILGLAVFLTRALI